MGSYESELLFGVVFRDFRRYKVTFSQVDMRYPINKIEEFLVKNIVSNGTTVCEAVSSV